MGAGLMKGMIPTGNAKRETGEDISFKEVDMEKLRAATLEGRSGDISWDIKDENEPIKVHDNKSPGSALFGLPTTEHVRSSLLPSRVPNPVDPFIGFSDAFKSGDAFNSQVAAAILPARNNADLSNYYNNNFIQSARPSQEVVAQLVSPQSSEEDDIGQI